MKKPLKILLLEDSNIDGEIIQRLLFKEVNNCECKLAMTKKTFLTVLDEYIPDVILSDNSLPRFDAVEALKIVRERFPHLPFILVTGTVSEEYATNIIKMGADDYVLKDRLARLPSAINTALRQRKTEKEKVEVVEQLKVSEERYRTLVEQAFDGILIYSPDGSIIDCNDTGCHYLGYTKKELKERTLPQLFFEDDLKKAPLHFKTLRTGHPVCDYRKLKQKNGSYLEMEICTKMLPDGNMMAIARDMTERKKSEQRIAQSEENLKAIFDNAAEGFVLMDENFIIKAFNNKASVTIFQDIEKDVKAGKSIFDFAEEERKAALQGILASVMLGKNVHFDRCYVKKDGSISWINFSFNPVKSADVVTGICATGRDITERKIAEQQVEFDSNNLNALINNTQDLMWSVDKDLKLIAFNNSFNEVITFMSGKALTKGRDILSTQFTEDQRVRYKILYERALSGETFTIIDHFVASIEVWSEISFYPIRRGKEVIGTACFSRDITARKKAEAELRKMEEEKLQSKILEQQSITRAMLKAQEKERHNIGIELHDNVNQILVGTNLILSHAKTNPDNIMELIDSSMVYLQDAIKENRKIAHVFVSPDLDVSLLKQLKTLTSSMLEVSGIKTTFFSDSFDEGLLDTEKKINIYRIAQEQCTNIVKYAHATCVKIKLCTSSNHFTMVIKDNGNGVDLSKSCMGIGLRNIKGRLSIFNGTAEVSSIPDGGFSLKVGIPLMQLN